MSVVTIAQISAPDIWTSTNPERHLSHRYTWLPVGDTAMLPAA